MWENVFDWEAQRAMNESEDRFHTVFGMAPDAIFIVDADGRFMEVNDAACLQLSYRKAELLKKTLYDVVSPQFRDKIAAQLSGRTDLPGFYEITHVKKDGSEVYVAMAVRGIFFKGMPAMVGIARDITERRRTEEALRESERTLATLISNLPGMVYRCKNGPPGTMMFMSDGCLALTGRTPEDFIRDASVTYRGMILPEDREMVRELIDRAIAERRQYEITYRICTADGRTAWMWERGRASFDKDGTVQFLEGFVTDITQTRKAEEERQSLADQLSQAQKMESVGRLAGGIAHDFNNLLTGIIGNVSLALLDIEQTDPMRQVLMDISQAAYSAAVLTRQLLAFSRKEVMLPKIVDLGALIIGMKAMLVRLIGEDIELHARYPKGLWNVKVDPVQVEQIVVNLAVNARDAMPNGGTLSVEVSNFPLAQERSLAHGKQPSGNYILLEIRDNGEGMSEDAKRHLFEPFFTTKGRGKGTGLGLPMVYGVIQQNRGAVEISSELGRGTTVKIYLPRCEEREEAAVPVEYFLKAPRGTETIMLVEDDSIVRNLGRRILEKLGYTVVACASGQDAIKTFEKQEKQIHLLLTDIVMPGMNGKNLASKLMTESPELKVVYTSGYTDDVITDRGLLPPGTRFIPKPFTSDTLAREVRRALDDGFSG
jgi:two-component system cell cycle sensor histidine kinase/response regulator CckA